MLYIFKFCFYIYIYNFVKIHKYTCIYIIYFLVICSFSFPSLSLCFFFSLSLPPIYLVGVHLYFSPCFNNNNKIYLDEYVYTNICRGLKRHYFVLQIENLTCFTPSFITQTHKSLCKSTGIALLQYLLMKI